MRGLTPESSPLISQGPTVADKPGTHALNNNKWNCKKKKKSGRLVKFQHKDSPSEQYRQGMGNSGFRPHMIYILDALFFPPKRGHDIG